MNSFNTYTVSFFGHRDFTEHLKLEPVLENSLKDILSEHEFVEFLVGRNGEFDQFVSSTIRKVKRLFYSDNSEHICILPYETAQFKENKEEFFRYYDRVEICEPTRSIHFKSAIKNRNNDMILRSKLVICYVCYDTGGAYNALIFAKKNHIPVVNLAEYITKNR